MLPRISSVLTKEKYKLNVRFEDGTEVVYDVMEDIDAIPAFKVLLNQQELFECVKLDESRTCVFWNDEIDISSDTIYRYGK